jgi:uncharacterized membrane protein
MPLHPSTRPMPAAESFHSLWVVFPAALYTSCFVGFVIFAFTRDVFFWDVALLTNLIGVISALVAAMTGVHANRRAPASDPRARVLVRRHALFHVQALIFFVLNLVVHHDQFFRSRAELRALATGVGLPAIDVTLPVILAGAGLISTIVAAQAGFLIAARRRGVARAVPKMPRIHAAKPVRASGRA